MHVFTLFAHIIFFFFVITNSHQSVQIPVYSFHIRRLNCYWGGGGGGGLILVDVENWLDNARMYNGYLKINKKKK